MIKKIDALLFILYNLALLFFEKLISSRKEGLETFIENYSDVFIEIEASKFNYFGIASQCIQCGMCDYSELERIQIEQVPIDTLSKSIKRHPELSKIFTGRFSDLEYFYKSNIEQREIEKLLSKCSILLKDGDS